MAEIGEAASGSRIELRVGESRVAVLPENPTTGFRWTIETDASPVLSIDGSQFRLRARTPGAGGERVFAISALLPGSVTLSWKRWRAWEGEASVDRRFALEFVVK